MFIEDGRLRTSVPARNVLTTKRIAEDFDYPIEIESSFASIRDAGSDEQCVRRTIHISGPDDPAG